MNSDLEKVERDGRVLGIILRSSYSRDGIGFFTPGEYSQQLGYMKRPKGYAIPAHVHNEVRREVFSTQETLFVRSGKVKVDFYDENGQPVDNRVLETGDVILFVAGGHGLEMLEDTEIIEVKQGPYAGNADKSLIE